MIIEVICALIPLLGLASIFCIYEYFPMNPGRIINLDMFQYHGNIAGAFAEIQRYREAGLEIIRDLENASVPIKTTWESTPTGLYVTKHEPWDPAKHETWDRQRSSSSMASSYADGTPVPWWKEWWRRICYDT